MSDPLQSSLRSRSGIGLSRRGGRSEGIDPPPRFPPYIAPNHQSVTGVLVTSTENEHEFKRWPDSSHLTERPPI